MDTYVHIYMCIYIYVHMPIYIYIGIVTLGTHIASSTSAVRCAGPWTRRPPHVSHPEPLTVPGSATWRDEWEGGDEEEAREGG